MPRPRMDVEAQAAMRELVVETLRDHPDHPLYDALIDPSTGELWGASSRLGDDGLYDRAAVDVGHKHYGKGDQAQFALELSWDNRDMGMRSGENTVIFAERVFVEVEGPTGGSIPVDLNTLRRLEGTGEVPAGTVDAADLSEGWRAEDLLEQQRFLELQAELPGTQQDRYDDMRRFVGEASAGSPPTPPELVVAATSTSDAPIPEGPGPQGEEPMPTDPDDAPKLIIPGQEPTSPPPELVLPPDVRDSMPATPTDDPSVTWDADDLGTPPPPTDDWNPNDPSSPAYDPSAGWDPGDPSSPGYDPTPPADDPVSYTTGWSQTDIWQDPDQGSPANDPSTNWSLNTPDGPGFDPSWIDPGGPAFETGPAPDPVDPGTGWGSTDTWQDADPGTFANDPATNWSLNTPDGPGYGFDPNDPSSPGYVPPPDLMQDWDPPVSFDPNDPSSPYYRPPEDY